MEWDRCRAKRTILCESGLSRPLGISRSALISSLSRFAPEKIPYAIQRYQNEALRLFSVLEDGLNAGKGEWLVGDKYSIADINGMSISRLELIPTDTQNTPEPLLLVQFLY